MITFVSGNEEGTWKRGLPSKNRTIKSDKIALNPAFSGKVKVKDLYMGTAFTQKSLLKTLNFFFF